MQFAHLYDVILRDADIDLRATFDSADKFDLPGAGAAFQKMIFRLTIDSPSPQAQVLKLAAHAERGCTTAQSIRQPVPVELEVFHKG